MKKIVEFLLGKKVDLDNDGKIESYREEVRGVFAKFKTQSDKLDEVNSKLEQVVEEERLKAEKARLKAEDSDKRAEKALLEHELNVKLKERLKDFIF